MSESSDPLLEKNLSPVINWKFEINGLLIVAWYEACCIDVNKQLLQEFCRLMTVSLWGLGGAKSVESWVSLAWAVFGKEHKDVLLSSVCIGEYRRIEDAVELISLFVNWRGVDFGYWMLPLSCVDAMRWLLEAVDWLRLENVNAGSPWNAKLPGTNVDKLSRLLDITGCMLLCKIDAEGCSR